MLVVRPVFSLIAAPLYVAGDTPPLLSPPLPVPEFAAEAHEVGFEPGAVAVVSALSQPLPLLFRLLPEPLMSPPEPLMLPPEPPVGFGEAGTVIGAGAMIVDFPPWVIVMTLGETVTGSSPHVTATGGGVTTVALPPQVTVTGGGETVVICPCGTAWVRVAV
jgi:hypothetical protein